MVTAHSIEIDLNTLMMLVNEIAKEDPLDYGDLAVDEMALRHSCCLGALNILQNAATFKAEDLMYVLLSSIAKLIEENVLLHAQNIERGAQIRNDLVIQILNRAKRNN
jgi:hypothetical protein